MYTDEREAFIKLAKWVHDRTLSGAIRKMKDKLKLL